jgi:hypothetical protein
MVYDVSIFRDGQTAKGRQNEMRLAWRLNRSRLVKRFFGMVRSEKGCRMDFVVINKKEGFEDALIDYAFLYDRHSPTIPSDKTVTARYSAFDIFAYPHTGIRKDSKNRDYVVSEKESLLSTGYTHWMDGGCRPDRLTELFKVLESGRELEGDFQLLKLTSEGNGFILGSESGWRQLYVYEDDHTVVLATSIKLIVDSVKKIHQNVFRENFDVGYIGDTFFRGTGNRKHPRRTIFRQIKKLYPFDKVFFENGATRIERKPLFEIPHAHIDAYSADPEAFYDALFERYNKFLDNVFSDDLGNTSSISVMLTGGYDSRATLALLYPFCKRNQIELTATTGGGPNYPDVMIAKQISETLGLKHTVPPQSDIAATPQDWADHQYTFYYSEGNWESSTFIKRNGLQALQKAAAGGVLSIRGADCFKRNTSALIMSNNRWYSSRTINRDPFAFPVLGTKTIGYLGWMCQPGLIGEQPGSEFVYQVIKRHAPALLDIPFWKKSLPKHYVPPYGCVSDLGRRNRMPIFWDNARVKQTAIPTIKAAFVHEYNSSKDAPHKRADIFRKLESKLPKSLMPLVKETHNALPQSFHRLENIGIGAYYWLKFNFFPFEHNKLFAMDLASVAELHTFSEMKESLT